MKNWILNYIMPLFKACHHILVCVRHERIGLIRDLNAVRPPVCVGRAIARNALMDRTVQPRTGQYPKIGHAQQYREADAG